MRRFERTRNDAGAAAVEFGLVAILLLTIITGIIQAALYFWAYEVGAHAAREGARRYAVDPCNSSGQNITITQSRAASAAEGLVDVGSPPAFAKGPGNTGADIEAGDQVTVSVTFTARSIGGLIPPFPEITKTATARVEDIGGCP